MAWTTPATWSVNEVVTASKMNTHIRDNLNYLKGAAGTIAFDAAATFGSVLALTGVSAAQSTINHTASSGAGLLDIGVLASDGTSNATLRAFRSTNTAGQVLFQVAKGNNTATINAQLAGSAASSYVCADNGSFGIGTSSPQGKLHGYDTIAGFMHYKFDGVDGTARTIIPDGAGDVLYYLWTGYVMRASDGTVSGGTVTNAPGGATSDLDPGGGTLTLAVAANGSVTIQRTAGALTYKVSLWLLWL